MLNDMEPTMSTDEYLNVPSSIASALHSLYYMASPQPRVCRALVLRGAGRPLAKQPVFNSLHLSGNGMLSWYHCFFLGR